MVRGIESMDEICGQTTSASPTTDAASSSGSHASCASSCASTSSYTTVYATSGPEASSRSAAPMLEKVRLLWLPTATTTLRSGALPESLELAIRS